MCMGSGAPTNDKAAEPDGKICGYMEEIATAPDVIETDYPYLFTGLDLTKLHR